VSEVLLVDTGAWIAFFDARDVGHKEVIELSDFLEEAELVIPWPVLYETLRTRFVRRPEWMAQLNARLKKRNVVFVDDAPYRADAYDLTVKSATVGRRHISMVDMVCRLIIADPGITIDCLITVNKGDFIDVCVRRSVDILP